MKLRRSALPTAAGVGVSRDVYYVLCKEKVLVFYSVVHSVFLFMFYHFVHI